MRVIAMIGPFPPPMHGMAAVNQAMRNFLTAKGENPEVFDLSAISLSRGLRVKMIRALRVFGQLWAYSRFLGAHPHVSVYISVSGGYGQLFEILFVLLSRFRKARIFLHHHSFLYIDQPSFLTRLLIFLSGKDACQIVLCGTMAEKLKLSYPSSREVEVLSNSALLFNGRSHSRIRDRMNTLGFLGNIEADKGIFEFLEVLSRLREMGKPVCGIIAGPFRDQATELQVRERIEQIGNIQYVGPRYGEEKYEFLDSIDVLLYPTRNDAEPLTILEAMANGVPVIARSKGCIAEMVNMTSGTVVDLDQDYASRAVDCLCSWAEVTEELAEKSMGAVQRYEDMRSKSTEALMSLYAMMTVQ